MDNTLISICVRDGSKGVPNKATMNFCGRTLLDRTLDQAEEIAAELGTGTIVSTNDPRVYRTAKHRGVNVFSRAPELCTNTASKWDVFRDIYNFFGSNTLIDLDIGCPLRIPDDIRACIYEFELHKYAILSTAYEAERNPYFNMVERAGPQGYRIAQGSGGIVCRQSAPQVYSLSPAVVIVSQSALFLYDHWSKCDSLGIHLLPRERAVDIDTQSDWEYAEYLMQKRDHIK